MALRAENQNGTESPPRDQGLLNNIQVIRAVAALLVVFVHLDQLLAQAGLRPFGDAGVDIFFVISGFIMVYTTMGRPVTAAQFMANRFARIAPIYWAITLAVFAIAVAAPSLLQATSANPVELIKSLAFIPFEKANGLVTPVLFVGWTLNYEMFFYLIFAIGLAFPRYGLGLLFTCAALAGLVAIGLFAPSENVLARFYTHPIMLEFALGIGIAVLTAGEGARAWCMRLSRHPLAIGAGVAAAIALSVALPLIFEGASRFWTSGLAGAVAVLGAVVLDRGGASLRNPLLLALGNASYAIYLTHPFVTQVAQKLFAALGLEGPLAAIAAILATLAGVCGVGYAVFRMLEKPLTNVARSLLGRRPASAKPVPAARPLP